jgi:electron transfer flavoprotein-quinone oxidoreductase
LDNFDVIVVGGGLAGLSAAYTLAKAGIGVLVVERGDYSGAKNVTGGRLYLNPIRSLLPDIWEQAPLERFVTKECIVMMGENASTAIELSSRKLGQKPYHSYTILRAKFDQWLADKVAEAGGMVITKNRVDELIMDGHTVRGIIAGEDKIPANVVLAADGVMSQVAEKAGLRQPQKPVDYAVAIKEVIELSSQTIEQRFNLEPGEGTARMYAGAITKGMFGGGFLYTNLNSVSLGLVVRIKDLMEKKPSLEAPQLFEDFKQRPEIKGLIAGGETIEYSAHVIPEAGMEGIGRLYGDGILVAGDAAGLALNTGITVRGMEFAIASGVMAARAIITATAKKDFSSQSLAEYERLLKDSFVLKDMATFKKAPHFLDNPRLMGLYPQFACDTLEKLMFIGDQPKKGLVSTAMAEVRKKLKISQIIKDGYTAFRSM